MTKTPYTKCYDMLRILRAVRKCEQMEGHSVMLQIRLFIAMLLPI